jgi:hypothetical protein
VLLARILAISHVGCARRSIVPQSAVVVQRRSAVVKPMTASQSPLKQPLFGPLLKRPLCAHRGQDAAGVKTAATLKMIRAASTPCQCMQISRLCTIFVYNATRSSAVLTTRSAGRSPRSPCGLQIARVLQVDGVYPWARPAWRTSRRKSGAETSTVRHIS